MKDFYSYFNVRCHIKNIHRSIKFQGSVNAYAGHGVLSVGVLSICLICYTTMFSLGNYTYLFMLFRTPLQKINLLFFYLLIAAGFCYGGRFHDGLIHTLYQHPVTSRNPVQFDAVSEKQHIIILDLSIYRVRPMADKS